MKIAVDFSHLVLLMDLRTMQKDWFLLPEGMTTPVRVPGMTIDTLKQLINPQLVDELVQTRVPVATPTEDVVAHVQQAPAAAVTQGAAVLQPGSLGPAAGRMDPFGAAEG